MPLHVRNGHKTFDSYRDICLKVAFDLNSNPRAVGWEKNYSFVFKDLINFRFELQNKPLLLESHTFLFLYFLEA